jgi:DNA invertase Pin-like site-specific DNA recombinase
MQAISYLRVSGLSQVAGDGFERQREAIKARAAALGLVLGAEFRDEGISGTKGFEDRPGLTAALEAAAESGAVLLVEKADRLARDLVVSELTLREARRLNVRVVDAESGTDLTSDSSNPTAVMLRQILGAVAEFEKSALVAKLRAARQRVKDRTGKMPGGRRPFGALPSEAETLATMRSMAAQGLTWEAVADALNAEGRTTRSGRPWSRGAVHGVLGGVREPVAG